VFGGGLTPFVTASLLAATHTSWSVAGYIDVLAVISLTSIVLLRQQANVPEQRSSRSNRECLARFCFRYPWVSR
jgi:hypothetical protein